MSSGYKANYNITLTFSRLNLLETSLCANMLFFTLHLWSKQKSAVVTKHVNIHLGRCSLWIALCNFGHFYLVSKIAQKLLKLEPWNLMNRMVVVSRWLDLLLNKFWKIFLELWLFVNLGIFPLSAKYLKNYLILEPWKLMNRLVMMCRWPDLILNKFWKIFHE